MSDKFGYYMSILQNRDRSMLVLAGLVLTCLVWWSLLGRWPRLRRWLSWAAVVGYMIVMVTLTFVEVPSV